MFLVFSLHLETTKFADNSLIIIVDCSMDDETFSQPLQMNSFCGGFKTCFQQNMLIIEHGEFMEQIALKSK